MPKSSLTTWEGLRILFITRFGEPAAPIVAALLGGSQAPPSDRHVKPYFCQIVAASKRPGAPPGWAAPEADLTFDSEDHPTSTVGSGALPMLCAPTICHVSITKMLIDGGASLHVLSVKAFSLLHVPFERLRPSKPFSGVGGGPARSLGQIRLPVTFGTRDNYRTELIDFDIPRISLCTTPSTSTQLWPSSWKQPILLTIS